MTLYNDLGHMCGQIKHAPEQVDLDAVRALLRRSQHYVDKVRDSLEDATVTLPGAMVVQLIDAKDDS
ncbi:hypothetical protein SAMN04488570_2819 [Nocardioides scoriae]|uniref:Uncharacterized protein n=1 Tax=Nocardioides scoriae TaxID=642780 RepID=A0A1H1VFY6_9ACTN|nr:hypothetical protein [Nocardioides scoriae]SDS83653.1 hypothetical protein SAMN04488570_2819 [Nocardioides scoriae]